MKYGILPLMLAFIALAGLIHPGAAAQENKQPSLEETIEDWPEVSKKAVNEMKSKYGEPDAVAEEAVVWIGNGPWKTTMVFKETIQHNFPMPHQDVLQQEIAFGVPTDKFDDLAEYDGSVVAARTFGTLAARCDKEAANFLALNLAHKIIKDEMSVEEARAAYADNIKKLMAGEKPEITQQLQFQPESLQVARDSGEAVMTRAASAR